MTWAIIPLAGPDIYTDKYGIKPLFNINGVPLLLKAIESRPWFVNKELSPEKMIFVILEGNEKDTLIKFLRQKYSKCQVATISRVTRGALSSVLAGASLIRDFDSPIIIDLVDILYNLKISLKDEFGKNPHLGAIVPWFNSSNPTYSYLILQNSFVRESVEKKVISQHASAGTYIFRNLAIFLKAAADSFEFENLYSVQSNIFVCPALNGVLRQGKLVFATEVNEVDEISLKFH